MPEVVALQNLTLLLTKSSKNVTFYSTSLIHVHFMHPLYIFCTASNLSVENMNFFTDRVKDYKTLISRRIYLMIRYIPVIFSFKKVL